MNRARRTIATLSVMTVTALLAASSADAASFCGKAGRLKVYSTNVTCPTALAYVRVLRCPANWRRYNVVSEFGLQIRGYGCRAASRNFWGTL